MAYTRNYTNGWQNGSSGGTPITAATLNHIEAGLVNLNSALLSDNVQTLTVVTTSYDAAHMLQYDGSYLNNTNFPGSSFLVILFGSATSNRASAFLLSLDANNYDVATIAESVSGAMSIRFNTVGTAYVTTSSSTGYTVYASVIRLR